MLTSPDLTNSLSDFSVYSAIAHLYTACAKKKKERKKDFVHLCVFVYHLDVRVWSRPTHVARPPAFSVVKPACADEAVGRDLLMRESQRGLFVNMQMRGMSKWEGARRECVPHALLFICSP